MQNLFKMFKIKKVIHFAKSSQDIQSSNNISECLIEQCRWFSILGSGYQALIQAGVNL